MTINQRVMDSPNPTQRIQSLEETSRLLDTSVHEFEQWMETLKKYSSQFLNSLPDLPAQDLNYDLHNIRAPFSARGVPFETIFRDLECN